MTIRQAVKVDHDFIFSLSPMLASVANLVWHNNEVIEKMQDDYIALMLKETDIPAVTLVAEQEGEKLGFIHVRTKLDDISGETIGTVPLLAVMPKAQGLGVGRCLMNEAEIWAREQNCRLLHLEVFANNHKAQKFYRTLEFEPEMLHMVKQIKSN